MKWTIVFVSLAANVVMFAALLWGATNNWLFFNRATPFDAAAIGLGAATLVLAATGVIVALLTYIGFKNIRQRAVKEARKVAQVEAREVAEAVASRVAISTAPSPTTPSDADALAKLLE